MKRKIGFYYDASHFENFSIELYNQGKIGVSGTDSSFLRVVGGLASQNEFETFMFGKGINNFPGLKFSHADDIENAVLLAKQNEIDILIFNLKVIAETDKAIIIAEQLGQKLVVWAQNPIEHDSLDRLTKSDAVQKIVFVESFDLNCIRHKKGFYKGVIIPNGIEKEVYVKGDIALPLNNNVFFLGSLTPSKGFHYLAKAWPKILAKVPDATLYIIGSGKLYNNHAKLGPLGIAFEEYEKILTPYIGRNTAELEKNNVKCLGLLNRNQIIELIYNSKVGCINPATYGSLESCSVSSLEIQMCGVPIIAGRGGGNLNTIKHNKTGYLIKNQETELPDAIIKLLRDDKLNLKFRENARNYMLQKYELNIVLQQWTDFLNKLVEGQNFKLPTITPEIMSGKMLVKEAIRLANKVRNKFKP
jgi:glycosyltransferase involved in cell wall biosynthesis